MSKTNFKLFIVFFFTLLLNSVLHSQNLQNDFDKFLKTNFADDKPGGVVVVTQNSKILYNGAFGIANTELNVKMNTDAVFNIASISKTFTAAAILQLYEKGKIKLNEKVSNYLKNIPESWDDITVFQLLNHTSGIKNYTRLKEYSKEFRTKDVSLDEMIKLFSDLPLDFNPGTRWRYNNSGYIILSKLIEIVSGFSYNDYIKQNLFYSFNLTSFSEDKPEEEINNRVLGYYFDNNQLFNMPYENFSQNYGAGGHQINAGHLSKWFNKLINGEIISDSLIQKMISPSSGFNKGRPSEYGLGIWTETFRDLKIAKSEGYVKGFYSIVYLVPKENIVVTVLTNSGQGKQVDPNYIARWISAYLIGQPYKTWHTKKINSKILDKYIGVYRVNNNTLRYVTKENNGLYTMLTNGMRLKASSASENEFFYKNTFMDFYFVCSPEGKVEKMVMNTPDGKQEAQKTDLPLRTPIFLDIELLKKYVGTYDFGFAKFKVFLKEEKLFIDDGRRASELMPKTENVFFVKDADMYWSFIKDNVNNSYKLNYRFGNRNYTGDKEKSE